MAVYGNRICRECGMIFEGGPRAWYCPECRHERRKRRDVERKNRPSKRPLGSKDICENCGKEYIVNCGLQKYCPDCQKEMHRKIDNEQGIKYYHSHYADEEGKAHRNEVRRKNYEKNRDTINAKRRAKAQNKKRSEKS